MDGEASFTLFGFESCWILFQAAAPFQLNSHIRIFSCGCSLNFHVFSVWRMTRSFFNKESSFMITKLKLLKSSRILTAILDCDPEKLFKLGRSS